MAQHWSARAACQAPDAPSMFVDDWGTGRHGRARRARALAVCRTCPVMLECGQQALAEWDAGMELYGIRSGIVFNDLQPQRQERQVIRLRKVVDGLDGPCDAVSPVDTLMTHQPLTLTRTA